MFFVLCVYGHTWRSKKHAFSQIHVAGTVSQGFTAAFGAEAYFVYKSSGVGHFLYPLALIIHYAKCEFVAIVGINLFFYQVIAVPGAKDFVPLSVVGNLCFFTAFSIIAECFAVVWRIGFTAA